jgi:hypothetical protein
MITFFKPGYQVLDRTNYSPPPDNEAEMSHRISRWHRQTVELEPFRGTAREWAGELEFLRMRLGWGAKINDLMPVLNDYWKYMPTTVLAIVEEGRRIPADVRYHLRVLDDWHTSETELRALAKKKGLSP